MRTITASTAAHWHTQKFIASAGIRPNGVRLKVKFGANTASLLLLLLLLAIKNDDKIVIGWRTKTGVAQHNINPNQNTCAGHNSPRQLAQPNITIDSFVSLPVSIEIQRLLQDKYISYFVYVLCADADMTANQYCCGASSIPQAAELVFNSNAFSKCV